MSLRGRTKNWVARVHLLAEMDRELHHLHRKQHRRWSARKTAKLLGVTESDLSMCLQLDASFPTFPQLRSYSSIRRAYDALQRIRVP